MSASRIVLPAGFGDAVEKQRDRLIGVLGVLEMMRACVPSTPLPNLDASCDLLVDHVQSIVTALEQQSLISAAEAARSEREELP